MTLSVNTNVAAMGGAAEPERLDPRAGSDAEPGLDRAPGSSGPRTTAPSRHRPGHAGRYRRDDRGDRQPQPRQGITDVALAAGRSISDLLVQMKEKAIAANDASIDTSARNALNEDFRSLRSQIATIVQNAKFDGANLINGSVATGIRCWPTPTPPAPSLTPENMSVSGSIVTLTSTTA